MIRHHDLDDVSAIVQHPTDQSARWSKRCMANLGEAYDPGWVWAFVKRHALTGVTLVLIWLWGTTTGVSQSVGAVSALSVIFAQVSGALLLSAAVHSEVEAIHRVGVWVQEHSTRIDRSERWAKTLLKYIPAILGSRLPIVTMTFFGLGIGLYILFALISLIPGIWSIGYAVRHVGQSNVH